MSKIIMGENVQLWVSGSCLAMATNLSVEMSADAVDISSKDHGRWSASRLGKISWTASSDDLFTLDDYNRLVDCMVKNLPIDLVFSTVANTAAVKAPDEDGLVTPATGWKASNNMYGGKAVITSLSLSANNGAVATYTVKFNGVGPLTKGSGTASA